MTAPRVEVVAVSVPPEWGCASWEEKRPSVSDDIEKLWPSLDAGMKYLRDK